MTINLIQTAEDVTYKPNDNRKPKPVIDMKKIKRKDSKYITKETQQTMKDRQQRIRENLQKQRQNK